MNINDNTGNTNTHELMNELGRLRSLLADRNETISQQEATIADKDRLINSTNRLGLAYSTVPEEGDAQRLLAGQVPVLVPDDEHSTVKNTTETDHVLIEGDNLTSLTMLQETHKGKVNVIYIDPPYNTGHQDFVYNDRFVDSEDGYRHSKWLSFMKPRLTLARNLLTDDGVIFVSIDDHEQAYLKILMDEIFGESNSISNFIWHKRSRLNSAIRVSTDTEYIMCYAKGIDKACIKGEQTGGVFPLRDDYYHIRGGYRLNQMDRRLTYSKGLDYSIDTPYGTAYPGGSQGQYEKRQSAGAHPRDWCWRWSKAKLQQGLQNGFIVFKRSKDGAPKIYYKMYERVDNNENPTQRIVQPSSLIDGVASTSDGSADIRSIFGEGSSFSFPKPVSLIKNLIKMHPNDDAIILDFFAGSGTTGQAVAELNAEDGGHRQAILCTNNFEQDGSANGIARDVTAVRMRRVLTGADWADGKDHEPLPGNLRYYRTEFRNSPQQSEDIFTMMETPDDMDGIINLSNNTFQRVGIDTIPPEYEELRNVITDNHAALFNNAMNDYTLVYKDWAEVMGEDDASLDLDDDEPTRFDLVRAEYDRLTNGSGKLYIATLDEHDDNGVVYPLPYIQHVHKTIQGLEHQGMLSRDK